MEAQASKGPRRLQGFSRLVREEPMGIEKMLPNPVRVVVPKKGKKKKKVKVVKLGPCGDKAVAGTGCCRCIESSRSTGHRC